MHLQGHFGASRQKPVVDGHKLQQGKVLLDIGEKKKSSWWAGVQHLEKDQRCGGTFILADL